MKAWDVAVSSRRLIKGLPFLEISVAGKVLVDVDREKKWMGLSSYGLDPLFDQLRELARRKVCGRPRVTLKSEGGVDSSRLKGEQETQERQQAKNSPAKKR